MKTRVGDRFKYVLSSNLILECIIMVDGKKGHECIDLGDGSNGWTKIGEIKYSPIWIDRKNTETLYLGNFSKGNSFETLYSKLNEKG